MQQPEGGEGCLEPFQRRCGRQDREARCLRPCDRSTQQSGAAGRQPALMGKDGEGGGGDDCWSRAPAMIPNAVDRCLDSNADPPSPCRGWDPATPIEFNDLVLILDAPALPRPPWKLPNLPEETDTCAATENMTPSSGCDLAPDFHLSEPWSPPRHHRRSNSYLGNRPRTFSEYSPPPQGSRNSPCRQPRYQRSASASLLSSSTSPGAREKEREGEGEWGGERAADDGGGRQGRAGTFGCGGGGPDPFVDWSFDPRKWTEASGK